MAVEIIKKSRELSEIEQYLMTADNGIISMKDVEDGKSIKVAGWLEFTDTKENGEVAEMLSVLDDENNAYTTQSATFKESFHNIANIMGDKPFAIVKISGQTKAGRDYVNCTLDKSSIK